MLEIRNRAEAEREIKRREEAGESTDGVKPGTVDWLYGTKSPEEHHEQEEVETEEAKDVVTSNMWEDDEDNPVRGQVRKFY